MFRDIFVHFCSFNTFKVSLCKDELSVVVVTVIIGFVCGQSSLQHRCEVRNFRLCGKINEHKIVPTLRKIFVARGIKGINVTEMDHKVLSLIYPVMSYLLFSFCRCV